MWLRGNATVWLFFGGNAKLGLRLTLVLDLNNVYMWRLITH